MSTLWTVEAQLSLHKHDHYKKAPEPQECQETGGVPAKVKQLH